ncbi:MAG: hypothetical protein RLN85_09655 [Pseudomonadales bacterium]|jgi:hypothetical protein
MFKTFLSLFTSKPAAPARFNGKRWAMATESREIRLDRNEWVSFADRT